MSSKTRYPIKKLLQLDDELSASIKKYRFDNRIENESEAMRRLLRSGLGAERQKSDAMTYAKAELDG